MRQTDKPDPSSIHSCLGEGSKKAAQSRPVDIYVPPSKSLTQRAILVGALTPGWSMIYDPLHCDDSKVLIKALKQMGVDVRVKEKTAPQGKNLSGEPEEPCPNPGHRDILEIRGPRKFTAPKKRLFLNNAGTAVRFLAPLVTLLSPGESIVIDGVDAMRRRPMRGLLETLEKMGTEYECFETPFCPPVRLQRSGCDHDTGECRIKVELDPSGSSQQLSGLLMVGPKLPQGLDIHLSAPLPSAPYIDLTIDVMESFGIKVERGMGPKGETFSVPGGGYAPAKYHVEGDHSSASYILAASALTGKQVNVCNISSQSKQGDKIFADLLQDLCTPGLKEMDMHECPDVAPTALAVALFRKHPTRITNISHLRIKECDRLEVLANELKNLGAKIQVRDEGWDITPAALQGPALLDPHGDHRMAMVFGLVSLLVDEVKISNPDCVVKSFPNFWEVLEVFK